MSLRIRIELAITTREIKFFLSFDRAPPEITFSSNYRETLREKNEIKRFVSKSFEIGQNDDF